jgi:LPS sulfotransferase NodH
VFGMKAHFHHFEAALNWCPSMIELLSPLTYVYLNRRDKVAQAVSMAKAMQTDAWTSMDGPIEKILRYDEASIRRCLEEIGRQRAGWLRWFETRNVTPIVVNYEDLAADKADVVRSIVALFDVQRETPEKIFPPAVVRQGDETNIAWTMRFRRENEFLASNSAS